MASCACLFILLILLNTIHSTQSQSQFDTSTTYGYWLQKKFSLINLKAQSRFSGPVFDFPSMQMVENVTISTAGTTSANSCSRNLDRPMCLPSGGLIVASDFCSNGTKECPSELPEPDPIRPLRDFTFAPVSLIIQEIDQPPTTLNEPVSECGYSLPEEGAGVIIATTGSKNSCGFGNPYLSLDLNRAGSTNYTLIFQAQVEGMNSSSQ